MKNKIILITIFFLFFVPKIFCDNVEVSDAQRFFNNGDYYKALIEYTKNLKTSKSDDSYSQRGDVKFILGNYNGAVFDYTKALEIKISSDVYGKRAKANLLLKQYDNAVKDVEEALKIEKSGFLYGLRAINYLQKVILKH